MRAIHAQAREATDGGPLCLVRVEIEPERATVGEQVTWRLQVVRREGVDELEWGRQPVFPAFRAEWLPGRSGPDLRLEDGVLVRDYEERRALFPARAGRLVVPSAELICQDGAREQTVRIPEVALDAVPASEAGRPEGWQGLVGPVELSMSVSPRRVRLGEAVRISIVARGPANLWDAPSPLEGAFDPAEAELFPRPLRMARDAGRRLVLRRYFTYDLVPRRTGALRIPPPRLASYRPDTDRYVVAEAAGVTVQVDPAPTEAAEAGREAPPREEPPAPGGTAPLPLAWIGAGAAALLAAAAAALLLHRRAREPAPGQDEESCLARMHRADATGDADAAADALARAIRLALARSLPGAAARATEELHASAPPAAREPVEGLARLDRLRFAPGVDLQGKRDEVRAVADAFERWRADGGPERLARDC